MKEKPFLCKKTCVFDSNRYKRHNIYYFEEKPSRHFERVYVKDDKKEDKKPGLPKKAYPKKKPAGRPKAGIAGAKENG